MSASNPDHSLLKPCRGGGRPGARGGAGGAARARAAAAAAAHRGRDGPV